MTRPHVEATTRKTIEAKVQDRLPDTEQSFEKVLQELIRYVDELEHQADRTGRLEAQLMRDVAQSVGTDQDSSGLTTGPTSTQYEHRNKPDIERAREHAKQSAIDQGDVSDGPAESADAWADRGRQEDDTPGRGTGGRTR